MRIVVIKAQTCSKYAVFEPFLRAKLPIVPYTNRPHEHQNFGQKSRCFHNSFGKELDAIDAYTRQRLRVAMIHDHPTQRKGHVMKTKWNNEIFARIGLIPSMWLYYSKQFGYTLDDYIQRITVKAKAKQKRKMQRAKDKGQEYFTPDLVRKMQYAQRVAQYT